MATPGEPDGSPTNSVVQHQRDLLHKIRVVSFTANPAQPKPLETITLSWELIVPSTMTLAFNVVVGGKILPGASGTTTTTAPFTSANGTSTAEFGLTVKSSAASVLLKTLILTMDDLACAKSHIDAVGIRGRLFNAITANFQENSQFSLNPSVTVVVGDVIAIKIPLHLNIPDWFDATMDISITLKIGLGRQADVLVTAASDVHITWTWLQDLAGCTKFGQKLSQAFITQIVNNQLIPDVQSAITDEVIKTEQAAQASDPQHRNFILTAVTLTQDGIFYKVCPM